MEGTLKPYLNLGWIVKSETLLRLSTLKVLDNDNGLALVQPFDHWSCVQEIMYLHYLTQGYTTCWHVSKVEVYQ